MSYSIGIGALFDEFTFNKLRSLEIQIADRFAITSGLHQPPHITVKRPFAVSSLAELHKVQDIMTDIANNCDSFGVTFKASDNFKNKAVFLTPKNISQFAILHERIAGSLKKALNDSSATFEGDNIIFHSSVTLDLPPAKADQVKEFIDSQPTNFGGHIEKLGLFLRLDTGAHWIVLNEARLR